MTFEPYEGVRVAVLGGSGFIGRWVARELGRAGADVVCVVRDEAAAAAVFREYDINCDTVQWDLSLLDTLPELLEHIRPSTTYNLVGYGVDPDEREEHTAFSINRDLVMALCETIHLFRDREWQGQDLIHVGSALEYGAARGDLSEDSLPEPTTLYGRSKLAGTLNLRRLSRASGLRAMTARLFTVYGPGEHPGRLLPSLLETAQTGRSLALTAGLQRRDFTYVGEAAQGLLRLGLAIVEPGETINVATGKLHSVRSFVEIAARVLGLADNRLRFGGLTTRPEEMEHSEVNIDRLKNVTSWAPSLGIEEGVRETVDFLRRIGERS